MREPIEFIDYQDLNKIVYEQIKEEIRQLEEENKKLRDGLLFIYKECDYERVIDSNSRMEYGDNRIGECCRKLLTLKKTASLTPRGKSVHGVITRG